LISDRLAELGRFANTPTTSIGSRAFPASCPAATPPFHLLQTSIAQDAAAYWRSVGVECRVIRRPVRTGYKAGALQWDIDNEVHPDSRFFPVFDADFAPAPDWLPTAMPYFFDAAGVDQTNVSMVQGRWMHLNARCNPLTRLQELILNGHFYIEQVFRSRTDRPWNFNGTAGVWRRAVIEAVGGWEHDTIVEDSDLSIKCFDAGYRGVYVRDLGAPSELPVSIGDYRSQQTRWVKGMGQVFAKRWRSVLTSRDTNAKQKIEFLFHKLPSLTYLATVVFQLYFPLAIFVAVPFSYPWLGVNLGALVVFWLFYTLTLYRTLGLLRALAAQWRVIGVMVLSWGMAPLLSAAFLEGLFSHDATFTRTPKRAATIDTESERTWSMSSAGVRPPGAGSRTYGPDEAGLAEYVHGGDLDTPGGVPALGAGGRMLLLPTSLADAAASTVARPEEVAAGGVPRAARMPRCVTVASGGVGEAAGDVAFAGTPVDGDGFDEDAASYTVRTDTAETVTSVASGATSSDELGSPPTNTTPTTSVAMGSLSSGASAKAAADGGARSRARTPFWTTKFSVLPLFEAALAAWSAFAAVAAVFGLARAPIIDPVDGAANTDLAWLVAVVIFGAGSAVGLGWNASSSLGQMGWGFLCDLGRGVGRGAAAIGRCCCCGGRRRRSRGRPSAASDSGSVPGGEVGWDPARPAAEVGAPAPATVPAAV